VHYTPLVTSVQPNLRQPLLTAIIKDGVPVGDLEPLQFEQRLEELPQSLRQGV